MTDLKDIPIGSVRLSHSTMNIINTCERKFQLDKLLATTGERVHTADTILGTSYGVGIASYFIHQDKDKALYEAWMAYFPILETEKKNEVKCYNALMLTFPVIDKLLQEYEVVMFNGKPAVELSFCLRTGSKYYFVGYMDIVLKSKFTGKIVVLDAKTTGLALDNLDPVYKNSEQLIGYSITLDAIVGEEHSNYEVKYLVAQLGRDYTPKIRVFSFDKTLIDRLNWFLALGMDIERLARMEELDVYPMRGSSCLHYNRPCKHFGVCSLSSMDSPRVEKKDEIEYDFYFDMDTLIENHIERISK